MPAPPVLPSSSSQPSSPPEPTLSRPSEDDKPSERLADRIGVREQVFEGVKVEVGIVMCSFCDALFDANNRLFVAVCVI